MPAINRSAYVAGQQITKRLDALGNLQSGLFGVSWWFVRVHFVAGIAWAMAAAQTLSFAYMRTSVEKDFIMDSTIRALVTVGSTMLGAFAGAFAFGSLADAHGRKFAILTSFTLAHAVGVLCAASTGPEMLSVFRFVVGLGLGGQQPIIAALIMELSPTNIRGRALVYLDAWMPVGIICAVALCREIGPSIGWRAVAALSGGALLYLPVLYYCVPESPKWLASSGKIDEAVRVLRTIEQASSVFHGEHADDAIKNLGVPRDADESGGTKHMILQTHKPSFCVELTNRVRILTQFPYLTRTLMLWFVWIMLSLVSSALFVYLDGVFIRGITDSAERTLLIYSMYVAQFIGNLAACAFIDLIGRRYTIICFLILAASGSVLEVYLEHTTLCLMFSGCIRNFTYMGAFGCLFAYTPELYPTSIRVIGISYAWGISRLGTFAGPHVVIWMEESLGMSVAAVVWVFVAISLSVVVVIFVFGIETASYDSERAGSGGGRSTSMTSDPHHETNNGTIVVAYQKHEDDDDFADIERPRAKSSPSKHFII